MTATIARSYCRLRLSFYGMKHPQLCSSVPSKVQSPTVIKDIHRSAWYTSFFRSDQTSTSNKANKKSDDYGADSGPVKPKFPANAFVMFTQSIQDSIRQSNPGISRYNVILEAARRWKELDPEEKSQIALKRKELFEKYKADKHYYDNNMTSEQIEREQKEKGKKAQRALKKARRELGMPNRPMTAYNMFLSDQFHQRSHESSPIFFKIVKDRWNDLPEHDKKVYVEKSLDAQKQYQNELADWEESMIEAGRFDVVRKKTVEALKKENRKKSKVKGEST